MYTHVQEWEAQSERSAKHRDFAEQRRRHYTTNLELRCATTRVGAVDVSLGMYTRLGSLDCRAQR
jgi:hypothetical protein